MEGEALSGSVPLNGDTGSQLHAFSKKYLSNHLLSRFLCTINEVGNHPKTPANSQVSQCSFRVILAERSLQGHWQPRSHIPLPQWIVLGPTAPWCGSLAGESAVLPSSGHCGYFRQGFPQILALSGLGLCRRHPG